MKINYKKQVQEFHRENRFIIWHLHRWMWMHRGIPNRISPAEWEEGSIARWRTRPPGWVLMTAEMNAFCALSQISLYRAKVQVPPHPRKGGVGR